MNENIELSEKEVNTYKVDYHCGDVQYDCVTDCPFATPWITTDW